VLVAYTDDQNFISDSKEMKTREARQIGFAMITSMIILALLLVIHLIQQF